jgi:hypothetical protein
LEHSTIHRQEEGGTTFWGKFLPARFSCLRSQTIPLQFLQMSSEVCRRKN